MSEQKIVIRMMKMENDEKVLKGVGSFDSIRQASNAVAVLLTMFAYDADMWLEVDRE